MAESSWFKRLWDTFTDPTSAALDAPSTVLKPISPPTGLALQYTLKSRWVSSVAWSPDGRLLASSSDRGVQLWDPRTGRRLCLLKGKSSSVSWSPDGKLLASRSFDVRDDRTIRLWDPHTGRRLHTLKDWSRSLAWSPDGKLLASASDALDRSIRMWDPNTGQLLRTFEDQSLSLAWSPDGNILASVSDDWAVRLWDPSTGQLLCTLEDPSNSVVWSPDGKLLASCNGVWDPGTSQLLYPLLGLTNDVSYTNEINSVAWSPDGRLLASGSPGGAVQLWNTRTGQMLRILEGRRFRLYGVAWSPDGRLLAAGSADPGGGRIGSISLWRTDTWESLTDLAAGQNFHLDASWNSRFSFLVGTGHLHDIFVWHLDLMRLLQATPSSKVLHYSNANANVMRVDNKADSLSEAEVPLSNGANRLTTTPPSQVKTREHMAGLQQDRRNVALTLQGKISRQDFDVFLCHNRQDKTAVKQIGEQLKLKGILPWLDEWELRPGLPWQQLLEEQIMQINAAAVFVGKNGWGPWHRQELNAFLREFVRRGCPVIPVLLSDAPQEPPLPEFLKAMTWVDFRVQEPDPMQRLIWGITGRQEWRS